MKPKLVVIYSTKPIPYLDELESYHAIRYANPKYFKQAEYGANLVYTNDETIAEVYKRQYVDVRPLDYQDAPSAPAPKVETIADEIKVDNAEDLVDDIKDALAVDERKEWRKMSFIKQRALARKLFDGVDADAPSKKDEVEAFLTERLG